ncbi:hypothetical protein ACFQZE_11955 [Paenibacillus sp. GCM10027627]|uniref:hypothetical protein n=1 Tax=unclassified Paenibacillus TaxID=185978 RepID=UPI003627BE4C
MRRRANVLILMLMVAAVAVWNAGGNANSEHSSKTTFMSDVSSKAENAPEGVLLLYDSLAHRTPREGNVDMIQRLLASMGKEVKLQALDRYQQGEMSTFGAVIVIRNLPGLSRDDNEFIADLLSFDGFYLHIGDEPPRTLQAALQANIHVASPARAQISLGSIRQADLSDQTEAIPYFKQVSGKKHGEMTISGQTNIVPYGASQGKYAYVPYLGKGLAAELSIAFVLREWLGKEGNGRLALVFHEIYPFTDLKLLEKVADELYGAGIPFVYSIRPIFHNTDYPAMKRYLEVLKYAQSRNGTIFVNAPVVSPVAGIQETKLDEKMASFINLLAENGIAPLGIGADSEQFWRNERGIVQEGMGFFSTSVLFKGQSVLSQTEAQTARAFPFSMLSADRKSVFELFGTEEKLAPLPLHLAIAISFPEDAEQWREEFQSLKQSWLVFDDMKNGWHRTATSAHGIESRGGILYIDENVVSLTHSAHDVSTDYEYREKEKESFKWLFTVQNYFYLAVIGVSLLLFSVLLLFGYRLYKQKYMK